MRARAAEPVRLRRTCVQRRHVVVCIKSDGGALVADQLPQWAFDFGSRPQPDRGEALTGRPGQWTSAEQGAAARSRAGQGAPLGKRRPNQSSASS